MFKKMMFIIVLFFSLYTKASTNFLPTLMILYPNIAGTPTGDCMTCHTIDKWQRNAFGKDLQQYLRDHSESDEESRYYAMEFIAEGIEAIEDLDSDGDGVSNREELLGGTFPGDAQSF